jgi:hypothetical protein
MVENVIAPIIREGVPGFLALEGAVGTGLDATRRFIFPQDGSLSMADITFQAIGTFSAFTADIEVSLDGGANFSVIAAIDFAATPAARNDLGRTGIYRLNVTAFTGTSADVIVAIP